MGRLYQPLRAACHVSKCRNLGKPRREDARPVLSATLAVSRRPSAETSCKLTAVGWLACLDQASLPPVTPCHPLSPPVTPVTPVISTLESTVLQ